MPKQSGIYAIRNLHNGKMYIGSAVNISRRWELHRHQLGKNGHHSLLLQRAWNKHGKESFVFEVLEVVTDVTYLLTREQMYLDRYHPAYNISPTAGSSLGVKRTQAQKDFLAFLNTGKKASAETRAKMSQSRTGKPTWNKGGKMPDGFGVKIAAIHLGQKRPKISAVKKGKPGPNLGRQFSEEWKQHLREAGQRRTLSEAHKQAIARAHEGMKKPWVSEENKRRAKKAD